MNGRVCSSNNLLQPVACPNAESPPCPTAWCPEAEISSGDSAGRARHGLGQLWAGGWGGYTDRIQGKWVKTKCVMDWVMTHRQWVRSWGCSGLKYPPLTHFLCMSEATAFWTWTWKKALEYPKIISQSVFLCRVREKRINLDNELILFD